MNLTFASQLFSKLEVGGMGGREGGRGRGTVVEMKMAGNGEGQGLGEGESWEIERGQERRLARYLPRLPAPPAPPSLGTFCCGLSTSCA